MAFVCLGRPRLPDGWHLVKLAMLAQTGRPPPMAKFDGPAIIKLTATQSANVLALTASSYPHYCRRRATGLGR